MNMTDFTDILDRKGYEYNITDNAVTVTGGDKWGYVRLPNLTTLPTDVRFENGSNVCLPNLTTMPAGARFDNGGYVWLPNLRGGHTYQGSTRTFTNIDGYTMILEGSKVRNGVTIHNARYMMGGPVSDLPKCYVAEAQGMTAHGSTVKEAIEDLEYKIADSADKVALAREVVDSGKVTLDQFRGITGACREGTRAHLDGHGIDLDGLDELPLDKALALMSGTSFGDVFKRMIEGV